MAYELEYYLLITYFWVKLKRSYIGDQAGKG